MTTEDVLLTLALLFGVSCTCLVLHFAVTLLCNGFATTRPHVLLSYGDMLSFDSLRCAYCNKPMMDWRRNEKCHARKSRKMLKEGL